MLELVRSVPQRVDSGSIPFACVCCHCCQCCVFALRLRLLYPAIGSAIVFLTVYLCGCRVVEWCLVAVGLKLPFSRRFVVSARWDVMLDSTCIACTPILRGLAVLTRHVEVQISHMDSVALMLIGVVSKRLHASCFHTYEGQYSLFVWERNQERDAKYKVASSRSAD